MNVDSPSTHQDSPKVPWPKVAIGREPECGVLYIDAQPWPQGERSEETETYIPLSALLSDEVVEQLAARLYGGRSTPCSAALGWSRASESVREMYRQDARAHLQAVIEQVGGGRGER